MAQGQDEFRGETQSPDIEVLVLGPDGAPTRPPRRSGTWPRAGTARKIGAIVGIVAVFALGVTVGRSAIVHRSGTPIAATTPTAPSAATTGRLASPTLPRTSGVLDTSQPTVPAPPTGSAELGMPAGAGSAWPQVPGVCGRMTPQPRIDASKTFRTDEDLLVVTGGDPAMVDLRRGAVGTAVFEPDSAEVVTDIAMDRYGTVLLVSPCRGEGPGRVIRIPAGGAAGAVRLPEDLRRIALVPGGDRVWAAVATGSYGYSPVTLIAADNSGTSVTLPMGWEPLSGRGRQVLAQNGSGGWSRDRFAVFDTGSGGMLRRFGGADSSTEDVAVNAIASADYVAVAPWVCGAGCDLLRYDIATGDVLSTPMRPGSDRLLAAGGAISPDGTQLAIPLYSQPRSPEPFEPYRLGLDSPADAVRVGLVDLVDGSVRALPGVTSGLAPALAFSPDGALLLVAVGGGYKTDLLLYTAHGDGPYDTHLAAPGLVSFPSLAVATRP